MTHGLLTAGWRGFNFQNPERRNEKYRRFVREVPKTHGYEQQRFRMPDDRVGQSLPGCL